MELSIVLLITVIIKIICALFCGCLIFFICGMYIEKTEVNYVCSKCNGLHHKKNKFYKYDNRNCWRCNHHHDDHKGNCTSTNNSSIKTGYGQYTETIKEKVFDGYTFEPHETTRFVSITSGDYITIPYTEYIKVPKYKIEEKKIEKVGDIFKKLETPCYCTGCECDLCVEKIECEKCLCDKCTMDKDYKLFQIKYHLVLLLLSFLCPFVFNCSLIISFVIFGYFYQIYSYFLIIIPIINIIFMIFIIICSSARSIQKYIEATHELN